MKTGPSGLSALTREIDTGPGGAGVAAFFDVDQTILSVFSAIEFVRDGLVHGRMGPSDFLQTILTAARFELGHIGFSAFVTGTSQVLRGMDETEFLEIGERIFSERLAATIYPEARQLVRAHRRKGHTIALVSSATRYQIAPLAKDLDIEHVLCTELELRDGRFTGGVRRPTCYGVGKAVAAQRLAADRGLDLGQSFFYTDSDEDLPLLEIVGHPRPTNPNSRLERIAADRAWPTRRFTSRGTPGALEVTRTSLAVASLIPSLLLGLPAALLDGSWRRAVNLAISTWGEVGTALAGLDVQVTGEEHLWSHRPAVFIFNHQSGIDMLLLCKLLRRDIVGIAKQEVRRNPIFGPAFALAGTVFIDRANRERAVEAMKPAVKALRDGLSVVIAPEGTRSPTPRLNRFKKGAFHLAMQAGVPVVPIVFRNALDALPKHAYFVRPARIEIEVLSPVSTRDWTPENLDRQVQRIHQLYEDTLTG